MNRKDCDNSMKPRRRWNVMHAAVFASLICAGNAWGGSISLWREAVVTGDSVKVSDVCQLQGFSGETAKTYGDIIVTDSPIPGGSVIVSIDQLRGALRGDNVNLATVILRGATSCDVSRPERIAAKEKVEVETKTVRTGGAVRTLRNVIEEYLADEFAQEGGTARVQFGRASDSLLDLRERDYEFEITRTSGKKLGLIGLEVAVLADGEEVQSVPVMANVSFTKTVVVAARSVNSGAIISDEDVKAVQRSFTRLDEVGMSDLNAAIGQRAKRYIPFGKMIMNRDLETVPLVKRGQVVEVHSGSGGVVVVTAAKSLSDGAYGDVIELRTNDRGPEKFNAVVTGTGQATVLIGQVGINGLAMAGN